MAYSAIGSTTSLTGVTEAEVTVEAVGRGPDCAQYQEEAVTDANGAFRIRGLMPKVSRCCPVIGDVSSSRYKMALILPKCLPRLASYLLACTMLRNTCATPCSASTTLA